MLYVFHGIDVSVNVNVVIESVDAAHQSGVVIHLHAGELRHGVHLVLLHPFHDGAVVYVEYVGGLACLGVNHCPDAAPVAKHLGIVRIVAVGSHHAEVALGEIAHGTLHPRLHIEFLVLCRHLVHFDGQARQHPRFPDAVQEIHAEATVAAVEIGGIEHVVAQVSYEQPMAEVAMKRLSHFQISSYFIHFLHFLPLPYFSPAAAILFWRCRSCSSRKSETCSTVLRVTAIRPLRVYCSTQPNLSSA